MSLIKKIANGWNYHFNKSKYRDDQALKNVDFLLLKETPGVKIKRLKKLSDKLKKLSNRELGKHASEKLAQVINITQTDIRVLTRIQQIFQVKQHPLPEENMKFKQHVAKARYYIHFLYGQNVFILGETGHLIQATVIGPVPGKKEFVRLETTGLLVDIQKVSIHSSWLFLDEDDYDKTVDEPFVIYDDNVLEGWSPYKEALAQLKQTLEENNA